MCTVLIIPIKEGNIEKQVGNKNMIQKIFVQKSKNNAVEYGCVLF